MNRTYTPDLAPAVLDRLAAYAGRFRRHFKHPKQATYCSAYLQGLLLDGERKSIEPMTRRVHLPNGVKVADLDQALQQFLGQSHWDDRAVMRAYRSAMTEAFGSPAGIFVVDDTGLPKRGEHSVGVAHQYCGALGKKADCQLAASLHYVGPQGHSPLAMRLDLPKKWAEDSERLEKAGVPVDQRRMLTKGRIALELLDQMKSEGIAGRLVLADAGYGVAEVFRDGLDQRGLRYLVGVTGEMPAFQDEPTWDDPSPRRAGRNGRPPSRSKLAEASARPVTPTALAAKLPRCKVSWREGVKERLTGRFTWVRVWRAGGWEKGERRGKKPVWLLVEEQADGSIQFALSNLPPRTSRIKAVRLWRNRWKVEQGYQQMKEELGLDHHVGRSWRGFHHHVCLVMPAFGFLALERDREERDSAMPGKKGGTAR
ncbi:IS701 family transposase [Paludisphaera mucosa]|uniref:IS701 family transposase n=1 Tax=Paludisphaera mucosa TaxID=3030827 RepID=A0ABT6FIS2_9BACT|nr:IS701 family transposase [Paludisphaera mucosa]MDG3007477.1 IS701 family transposase [Paludisphaera mucosa]